MSSKTAVCTKRALLGACCLTRSTQSPNRVLVKRQLTAPSSLLTMSPPCDSVRVDGLGRFFTIHARPTAGVAQNAFERHLLVRYQGDLRRLAAAVVTFG